MLNKIFIVLVAVSASVTSCLGFTSSTFLKTNSFTSKLQDRQNSFLKINEEWRSKVIHMSQFQDFPPQNEEDDYTGDTDWDAEWKKVVSNQDQPKDRPGNYKSDIEIAATKAKVEAEKKLISVQNEAKRMSNFDSLKGDWKVCLVPALCEKIEAL